MSEVFNHLWQSTAFAAAIALATLALRRNSPRVRYWLWFAASMKFLIPFSLLVSTGARIQMPPDTPSLHAATVQQISAYFAPITSAPHQTTFQWPLAVWLAGSLLMVVRWFRNWRFVKTAATLEPGVHGLFRPVLRLPEGLTEEQLSAVIAHEERHIECFDNLTAALHMVVEMIFWFHPLVWWIGACLMDERERDCDEAVLRRGNAPSAYARSIVQVCQTYVESPLACAAGISGSDLKKRIREIMTWRGSLPVTKTGKAMLAVAAVAAVSLPFALGILRAQTLPPEPVVTYEAVSIHQSDPGSNNRMIGPGPQGGWRTVNTPALMLIAAAYSVPGYQIVGAPGWASSEGYDVTFTANKTDPVPAPANANAQRMRAILRDRFALVLRAETHELPIYNLTVTRSGHKLVPHDPAHGKSSMRSNGRQITAVDIPVSALANDLSGILGRPVSDVTHLAGGFDFTLSWTPDAQTPSADPSAPGSLFTELTDQLGLKLESAKGPVQVYVVEKIEHPTEN